MLGVFTFAGVVALPFEYLLPLVTAVYAAAWRTFMRAGCKPRKQAYSTVTVLAGCSGASATLTHLPGIVALPAAVLVFALINATLLALGMIVARDWLSLPYLRKWRVWAMVLGTQWLGAAVGLAVQWHPAGGIAVLPVVGLVHQEALRSTLRLTRACDGGIWNRAGWLALVEEAHRVGDRFTIILVELQDRHEANIAADIVQARMGGESIGRYRDAQLVLLLRESSEVSARLLAVRLTLALRKAGLHAGAGCADSQSAGSVAGMLTVAVCEAVIHRSQADAAPELR